MPRHTCPKHEDCYIDCPNGGYAFFVEPVGPCERDCDPVTFAALFTRIKDLRRHTLTSGVVDNLPAVALADLAARIERLTLHDLATEIEDLKTFADAPAELQVNATWNCEDVSSVMGILAAAGRMPL